MTILINGHHLDEPPRDLNTFYLHYPHFKESASNVRSIKPTVVGPVGLLYIFQREYAVTHVHDNKISIFGTDGITTGHVIIVRHSGSGVIGMSHLDRVYEDGLLAMIHQVQSTSYPYEGNLELHIIGGFSDNKSISHRLSIGVFQALHRIRLDLNLITCCIGEMCTHRKENGIPYPAIYGIGVNVKSGEIFPASFTEKGPDLDIRQARTLTGGENVGLLDLYDMTREELKIGPFSYEPMRAVDLWLQQSDEFLLQNLAAVPEVAPANFVANLRSTLKRIKDDPYPAVTLFQNNIPRYYRKDEISGHWVRIQKEENVPWTPIAQTTVTQGYY